MDLDEEFCIQDTLGTFNASSNGIDPQSNEFKNIEWKRLDLRIHSKETMFTGDESLPTEISSLRTPCDFFAYFVTDRFLTEIAKQTNMYAYQTNPNKKFEVNIMDLKKYIAILIFMSVYKYPNVRSYWGRHSFSPIQSAMTLRRFEEIRKYVHYADSTTMKTKDHPHYDALHKIRPVIIHFNERFSSVPTTVYKKW